VSKQQHKQKTQHGKHPTVVPGHADIRARETTNAGGTSIDNSKEEKQTPSCEQKNKHTNRLGPSAWAVFWVAVAGAFATVVYAIVAGSQWYVMRQQLKQMESQTRAWVGIAEGVGMRADPIIIDAGGNIRADCVITAKNYGTYPAQNVLPSCELMVLQGDITRVHREIRQVCREGVPAFGGSVLFQGHEDTWKWAASVAKSQVIRDPSGGPFLIFLIGSIQYRDQFNIGHCTAFGFKRNIPGTIKTVSFELIPNTTIPGEWVKWDGVVDPR
jgi:hypothetical protein